MSAMATQKRHHTLDELQTGLIHIQIHPIDALDLKGHVISQHISGATSYGHGRLRSSQALAAN
jgi:hypothetical protein